MFKKTKRIRVNLGLTRAPHTEVLSRGEAVCAAMKDNPVFEKSPVNPEELRAALDEYNTRIANGLDGGKKAIADRDQQRETVLSMLRLLGHHVEAACNNDMAVFLSSGFLPAAAVRSAPAPLAPAGVRKIMQGNSGQLLVSLIAVTRALSYEMRYAPFNGEGTLGPWITNTVTTVRVPTVLNGLTPGTTYAFQVRALGKLGYTDWSDSVTRMST
jgi:Fibronectin type III domain